MRKTEITNDIKKKISYIQKIKSTRNNKRKAKWVAIMIVMLLSFYYTPIYADIEDNEIIDIEKVKQETAIETSKTSNNVPKLNARIGLIYDRLSGKILYEKNGNKQTSMASTTKIMTAIVVIENSKLNDIVTIEKIAAGTGGSRLGLKVGDKITVRDLLYGLMLRSGNDAAVALAIHIGGSVSGFAEMMNTKAQELKLANSHFVVPHGLDIEGHYTTAYELAKMADYALKIPKIKEIVGTKTYTVTINGNPKVISNTNELLGNLNGVYGVKTGFTNGAGRCLVTACKRGNLDIITVVLGADTKKIRTVDSIQLIEYANKNYQIVEIKKQIEEQFEKWKKENQNKIQINKGVQDKIELALEELSYETMAIKKTQVDNIKTEVVTTYLIEAPIEEGKILGNVKVMIGDELIEVLNIYNKTQIKKKSIQDYMIEFFGIYKASL